MNFQKIPPIESSKDLLDQAFRKAREKGKEKKLAGNWLQIIRKKEGLKLDIIKDYINVKLEQIIQDFPNINALPEFYLKLIKLTLDHAELKKSLGGIDWVIKKIRFFHQNYVSLITKAKDRETIKNLSKQFYGRISSVLKQIEPQLKYLEHCRRIMRTYPDIKELFTVCIYGFPNVGKTTLLNKITGTKAKVAAYEFTTKTINSGILRLDEHKIQILDVPGTLARKEKMNEIEMQAELVLKELAELIIYVFDLSGENRYSFKEQEKLYKNLINNTPKQILVYVSKMDLIPIEEMDNFRYKYYSLEEIKEKIKTKIKENPEDQLSLTKKCGDLRRSS